MLVVCQLGAKWSGSVPTCEMKINLETEKKKLEEFVSAILLSDEYGHTHTDTKPSNR